MAAATRDELLHWENGADALVNNRSIRDYLQHRDRRRDIRRLADSTLISMTLLFHYAGPDSQTLAREARMRTQRRLTQLVLALHRWRVEHGELPETLDVLSSPYGDAFIAASAA